MDDYILPERTVKFCDFVLSSVDQDIADSCRDFGHTRYNSQTPIDIQMVRNLKSLTDAVNNLTKTLSLRTQPS